MALYDIDQEHDPGSVGAGIVWKRRGELYIRNTHNTAWTPIGTLDDWYLGGLQLAGGRLRSVITGRHDCAPIDSPDFVGCTINGVQALGADILSRKMEEVRQTFEGTADSAEGSVMFDTGTAVASSFAIGSGVLYAPNGNETLVIPRPWFKDANGLDVEQAKLSECVATIFATHMYAVPTSGLGFDASVMISYPDPANKLTFKVDSGFSIRNDSGAYQSLQPCSFAYIVAAVRY